MTTASKQSESARASRASKPRSRKRSEPSEEDVRILAYELFRRREADGLSGDAMSDWVEAEKTLSGPRAVEAGAA